jgi:DNA-binding transcriptional LysR family regulator
MSNICFIKTNTWSISMELETRHLRYFLVLAEELHFRRAAERLCIAQPPLSQQIQQLEQRLGFRLFERTQRRVELTAAGSLFYEEVRDIFARLERATALAKRAALGEVGRLAIGFVGTASYEVLPLVLREFRSRFPEVDLQLRELVSARQAEALREKRIQVGFARPPLVSQGIRCETLLQEPLLVALPETHPKAERTSISLSDLSEEPFILYPLSPKPCYAEEVMQACQEAGFVPNVVQETSEIHTALGLVAAGMGVTLVPACIRHQRREGMVFASLSAPFPMSTLSLVYLEENNSPVLQAFLAVCREVTG